MKKEEKEIKEEIKEVKEEIKEVKEEVKKSSKKNKIMTIMLCISFFCVFSILLFVIFGRDCLPFSKCDNGPKEEQKKEPPKVEEKYVMELDNYKGLLLNDIVSIEKIRYTEGGDQREEITEKEEITRTYNMLNRTKIGELTERACEDNTTVYVLKTSDKSYSFEFECDWFVYSGKHYNVVK